MAAGVSAVVAQANGMPARARPIRSSATPSCRSSRNRAAPSARTGWQPMPIVVDGADGRTGGDRAGLCQEPQPGRICLRPWLGRRLGARRRAAIIPSSRSPCRSRPVPGPRLLLRDPDAGARADRRARGGDRSARAVLGARDLHRARAGAAVRGGRLADPRRARNSTGATDGYAQLRRFPRRARQPQAQGDPQGARRRGRRADDPPL